MSDDESLNEALCALTQLTDEQLDGLVALSAMDADGIDKFGRQVEQVWDANRQAVTDARAAVDVAMQERLRVETECGVSARHRWLAQGGSGLPRLTEDESARCDEARNAWEAAKGAVAEAVQRFKQGVTVDQLVGVD